MEEEKEEEEGKEEEEDEGGLKQIRHEPQTEWIMPRIEKEKWKESEIGCRREWEERRGKREVGGRRWKEGRGKKWEEERENRKVGRMEAQGGKREETIGKKEERGKREG